MSANLNPQTKRTSDAWIGGAVLVLIGAVALAANFTTLPAYLMLMVPGLALLAWGLIARHIGPVIPGCILSSLSASTCQPRLMLGPLESTTCTGKSTWAAACRAAS